jgi:hypothetical protein
MMNDETMSKIEVMLLQEESYRTTDYLADEMTSLIEARQKMVHWMLSVAEFCRFQRETVEIAMNYADRFFLTTTKEKDSQFVSDPDLFQLVCMTSLYTAVKINEERVIDPAFVSTLSRGVHTPVDIETMEVALLDALNWRVNPPTTLSFVQEYLELLSSSFLDSKKTVQSVCNLTAQQIEFAVMRYEFISEKPSEIAYCALMNAMEGVMIDDAASLRHVRVELAELVGLDCLEAYRIQQRLRTAASLSDSATTSPVSPSCQEATRRRSSVAKIRRASLEESPRTVSTDWIEI